MVHKDQKEALLEGARVIVFAFVSWLLTEGVLVSLLGVFRLHLDPGLQLVTVSLITSVLKTIDSYLHEIAPKDTGWLQEKGLSNF